MRTTSPVVSLSLCKQPLIAFPSSLCLPPSALFLVVFLLLLGLEIPLFAEQPVEGSFWGTIRGCYGAFSSFIYRRTLLHTTPVSGGASNMNNAVEVARKPPTTIAPALYEFDHATLPQEVQVALNGPNRTLEGLGQGFHLGVALAGAVVGIVC